MDAQGGAAPWEDSGMEDVYAGLPFWVNASADYNNVASPAGSPASAPASQARPCSEAN